MIPAYVEREGKQLLNHWLEKYFIQQSPSDNSEEQADDMSILYKHAAKKIKTKLHYDLELFINVSSSLISMEF